MKNNIGFCGLDCSKCEAFIATATNDNKLREKTAKEWMERYIRKNMNRPSVKKEDINCYGCKSSGPIYLYCQKCQVRVCAKFKKVNDCAECNLYKCENLIQLQSKLYKKN